jgi:hypothetical protein
LFASCDVFLSVKLRLVDVSNVSRNLFVPGLPSHDSVFSGPEVWMRSKLGLDMNLPRL